MRTHLSKGWAEHKASEILDLQAQLAKTHSTDKSILDYIKESQKLFKLLENEGMGYLLKLQITTLLAAFQKSGKLDDGCTKWKDESEETMAHFTAFF